MKCGYNCQFFFVLSGKKSQTGHACHYQAAVFCQYALHVFFQASFYRISCSSASMTGTDAQHIAI
jgi:hypothetical protein